MRERRYAEKAAATACIGFAVTIGVMIRSAALLLRNYGLIGMAMRYAVMLCGDCHSVRLGQAMEHGGTASKCQCSRRYQDTDCVGHGDYNRSPPPQMFGQTVHRCFRVPVSATEIINRQYRLVLV